jgi:hypothetical protein
MKLVDPDAMARVASLLLSHHGNDGAGMRQAIQGCDIDQLASALMSATSLLAALTDHLTDQQLTDLVNALEGS